MMARAESPAQHSVSVNSVLKNADAGTSDYKMKYKSVEEILHIAKLPTLVLSDFSHASVQKKNGRTLLHVTLSDTGALKLGEYSESHLGEHLAILVDHRLMATPKIRLPMHGKAFQIDALERPEAEMIARAINHSS